jgi:hypothetical protein
VAAAHITTGMSTLPLIFLGQAPETGEYFGHLFLHLLPGQDAIQDGAVDHPAELILGVHVVTFAERELEGVEMTAFRAQLSGLPKKAVVNRGEGLSLFRVTWDTIRYSVL